MFGYVVADTEKLSDEDKARYNKFYCGLCHELQRKFGGIGRMTLTFDMTFLTILLSSLYGQDETDGMCRCPTHLITKHSYILTEVTKYSADMNILLSYYKNIDDWNDDHSITAKTIENKLKKFIPDIEKAWPRQCEAVSKGLYELSLMERRNEINPDLPTNCFGRLMGELFVIREDEYSESLRRMGAALGRYIYLLDACNDLVSDIKKERYNPLIAQFDTDYTPILTLMIGECTKEFESLPLKSDLDILRNILYSGVWVRKKRQKEGDN